MKAREVWALSANEIEGRLEDAYQELFNLRFQHATGQLRNHARLSQVRHEIARFRTVLQAKRQASGQA